MIKSVYGEQEYPQSNSGMLQIQKTKKTLDDLQFRMRSYKKQKQEMQRVHNSVNNNYNIYSSISNLQSPYPDLQQYLSNLVSQCSIDEKNRDKQKKYNHNCNNQSHQMHMTKHINSRSALNSHSSAIYLPDNINDRKKTEKDTLQHNDQYRISRLMGQNKQNSLANDIDNINNEHITIPPSLDLHKHTQQQLQKSHIIHLQKLHKHYQQSCDKMDSKISELKKQKSKIKQDKVLLMRENEQLQQRIEQIRNKKQNRDNNMVADVGQSSEHMLLSELNGVISKLTKKVARLELQNNKIVQRKKNLQTNMRVCLRNSQDGLRKQLESVKHNYPRQDSGSHCAHCQNGNTRIKKTKSKSVIMVNNHQNYPINRHARCPYH